MRELIHFLVQNPEVVEKVKIGHASLLGVSSDELKAIIDILTSKPIFRVDYWK